jgi:hypothetical protein
MNIHALLERPAVSRHRRVFPSTDPLDPEIRLTLRSELFLVAHEDETGRMHLDRRSMALALAVAVLLELWLDQRILVGKRYDIRTGRYLPDPGRIMIIDPAPYGDPLTDAAMTLLKRTGGAIYVTDFIRRFATLDLYDRVRGDMLAIGVLYRTTRRRFGLFTKDRYLPVKKAWAVQARAKLRDLPDPRGHEPAPAPDAQTLALAGLATALGLTRNLFDPEPAALHGRLMDIISLTYDNTVRDVQAAINSANRRHVR